MLRINENIQVRRSEVPANGAARSKDCGERSGGGQPERSEPHVSNEGAEMDVRTAEATARQMGRARPAQQT